MNFRAIFVATISMGALAAGSGSGHADIWYRTHSGTFVSVPQGDELILTASGSDRYDYGDQWALSFLPSGGKGPYLVSVTGMPSGVSAAGGTVSGSSVQSASLSAVVTDSAGTVSAPVVVDVQVGTSSLPLTFTSGALSYRFDKDAVWQVPYAAAGGRAPYIFGLPSGISAVEDPSSGLVVSGAGVVGVYTIGTISATDVAGTTASASPVTIVIGADGVLTASSAELTGLDITPIGAITKNITLTNTGDFPVAAPSPMVTGSFSIVPEGCSSQMAAGQICTIATTPVAVDNAPQLTGTITVVGHAPFLLSGKASGFGAIAALMPAMAISNIFDGTSPSASPAIFTVTNSGDRPSGTLTYALTAGSDSFALTGGTCSTSTDLASKTGSCTIEVARTATLSDAAPKSATLQVSFANGTTPVTASVTGTAAGFASVVAMTPKTATTDVTGGASPSVVPAVFTVSNTGDRASGALTYSLTSGGSDFAIAGGSCSSATDLAPNSGNCTIDVVRTAAANDASGKTATLQVSFATGMVPLTATVSGTASGFDAVVSMTTTAGTTSITNGVSPSTSPAIFTVSNTGVRPSGTVSYTMTAGSAWFVVSGGTCNAGTNLAANAGSCTVNVLRTASANDISRGGTLQVSFANGTAPATASVSGAAEGFDAVVAMTPSSSTSNTSGAISYSLTSGSSDFAIVGGSTCSSTDTLAVNSGNCTIRVSRMASDNDTTGKSATLQVTFANGTAPATATVSGTATGFLGCNNPGDTCTNSRIYLGTASSKKWYLDTTVRAAAAHATAVTTCAAASGGLLPPTSLPFQTAVKPILIAKLPPAIYYTADSDGSNVFAYTVSVSNVVSGSVSKTFARDYRCYYN
jgi:hypothetical protein